MSRDEDILVHNYNVEANLTRKMPERVIFWDETLRDGEQTPGVYYTLEETVRLATQLDEIGVDIITCGIPALSPNEVPAVTATAKEGPPPRLPGPCPTPPDARELVPRRRRYRPRPGRATPPIPVVSTAPSRGVCRAPLAGPRSGGPGTGLWTWRHRRRGVRAEI